SMKTTLNSNARAVLDAVRASQQHPTAIEVYEVVKQLRPRIGLATVYRILHSLVEQGLIKELGPASESVRYDGHISRHDHAVCTVCGALLDLPVDILLSPEILQAAAQAAGIELRSYEIRLYGPCSSCSSCSSCLSSETNQNENEKESTSCL
ncbi:MAG: transcriptional repressor, partial [Chloroflexota bacterium]|nr:transcriptional repressor [Chloroflexota bacterium]